MNLKKFYIFLTNNSRARRSEIFYHAAKVILNIVLNTVSAK